MAVSQDFIDYLDTVVPASPTTPGVGDDFTTWLDQNAPLTNEGNAGLTSPAAPSPNMYKPEQQEKIDKAIAFESSKLGKAFNASKLPLKLLGIDSGLTISERLEKQYLRDNEIEALPNMEDRILARTQDYIDGIQPGVSKIAPILLNPVSKLTGAAKIASQAAQTAGIIGGARTGEELASGKGLKESAESGLEAGLLGGAISGGIPAAGKLVKEFSKVLLSAGSKVKGYAVRGAMKDPVAIFEEQPTIYDVAKKLADEDIAIFGKKLKDNYGTAIEGIKGKIDKPVSLKAIHKSISDIDIPKEELSRILKSSKKQQLINISDDAIDKFVGSGDKISFNEAKKINSLLHDITYTGKSEAVGTGAIGRLSKVKESLLTNMEKAVPQIRKINKDYAKGSSLYKELNKLFGDTKSSESKLSVIGQQLSGVKKNKTSLINMLKKLEKETGSDILNQVRRSTISDEFEAQGVGELMDGLRLGGSALIGSAFGPLGIVGGAMSGAALSSPQAAKAAIKAGSKIGQSKAIKGVSELARRYAPIISTRKGE